MERAVTRGRLLIVDDDQSVSTLLMETLSNEGYECDSCPSGEQALELMKRRVYDALVLDLMMPGITGLEVLFTAKQSHPRTAFIVVTGMDDLQLAERALEQGADAYLTKPIHYRELSARISHAIDKKSQQGKGADLSPRR